MNIDVNVPDLSQVGKQLPSPPQLRATDGSGKEFGLEQVAVAMITDGLAQALIQGIGAVAAHNVILELEARGVIPPSPNPAPNAEA